MTAFVCLLEVELRFEAHDLKQKRKLVKSLKEQIRNRFGAAIAEIDHHDKWQRATLLVALVGDHEVGDRADGVQRFVDSRFPDGCTFERDLLSLSDLRG
ncbi:MAG: uncharacterized protein QOD60_2207 [Solirubrobacterales bacterium]|nr:uncharacterized protein [Solirubrobacterales bacterium]